MSPSQPSAKPSRGRATKEARERPQRQNKPRVRSERHADQRQKVLEFECEKAPVAGLQPPQALPLIRRDSVSRTIPLNHGYVAVVDEDDYAWLAEHRWHVMGLHAKTQVKHYYAARAVYDRRPDGTRKQRLLIMHREILRAKPTEMVDHIDGDGLNNQRSNLRIATASQNQRNMHVSKGLTSKYKGVSKWTGRAKFVSVISVCGKNTYLGDYTDEIEAARAYDRAALHYFGEFAQTNFPREVYDDGVNFGEDIHEGL